MEQRDRIAYNLSRFEQTSNEDALQRATCVKFWQEECKKLGSKVQELEALYRFNAQLVKDLESKLARIDAGNVLLQQSEYQQRVENWHVIAPADISIVSSISYCGNPIACPTSTESVLKVAEAELHVREDEGGGEDEEAHHHSHDISRQSSSSYDLVSDIDEAIDSPKPMVEQLQEKLEEERRHRHLCEGELAKEKVKVKQLYLEINNNSDEPLLKKIQKLEQSLEEARRSVEETGKELNQKLSEIEQMKNQIGDSKTTQQLTRTQEVEHDLEKEKQLRQDVEQKLRQSRAQVAQLKQRISDYPKIACQEIERRKQAEKVIDDQAVKMAEFENRITGLEHTNYALEVQVKEHESAFKEERADRVALNEKNKKAVRDQRVFERERDEAMARALASEMEIYRLREENSHTASRNVQQPREPEASYREDPEDLNVRRKMNEQRRLIQNKEILKRERDEAAARVAASDREIQQLREAHPILQGATGPMIIEKPVFKNEQVNQVSTKEEAVDNQETLEAARDKAVALAVTKERELQHLREACANLGSMTHQMKNLKVSSGRSADVSTQSSPPTNTDPHVSVLEPVHPVVVANPGSTLANPDLTLANPGLTLANPDPMLANPDPTLANPGPTLANPDPTLASSSQGAENTTDLTILEKKQCGVTKPNTST